MTRTAVRVAFALALVGLYLTSPALPAAAAADGSAPVFATFSGYWAQFTDFWVGAFKKQSGIVLGAIGLAIVCLFIITRAKWRK